jgi:hypothetical protein
LSTLRKRIVGVLAATILATSVISTTQSSPALAAGCRGPSCNGQYPNEMGCDADARTLESFRQANTFIELRYSPSCYAAWARGISYNTWRNCTGWTDQDVLWVEGSSGGVIRVRYGRCLSNAPSYQFWTAMVGFNYWTRACLVNYAAHSSTPRYNGCTGWR